MFVFLGAEDFARFALFVVTEFFLHGHDRQDVPIGFSEGDALAGLDRIGKLAIDRQRQRNAPHLAVGQAHLGDDALVIIVREETRQRRNRADGEQFHIADGERAEHNFRKASGFLQGGCPLIGGNKNAREGRLL